MASIVTIPRVKIAYSSTLQWGDPSAAPSTTEVGVGVGGVGIAPTVGSAPGNISSNWAIGPTSQPLQALVSAGTPFVIDVTNLTDVDTTTITLARVQGIWIENLSTTSGQIMTLTGGSSNPLFTDSYTAQPNLEGIPNCAGSWQPYPGFSVSGSAKTIKITVASGTNVPFAICIVGNLA